MAEPPSYRVLVLLLVLCIATVIQNADMPPVPFPPTMIKQPPHEQLYRVAHNQDEKDHPFTLDCEAKGVPEPEYRWTKNGDIFEYDVYDKRISQQPRSGTLVFTKPEDVDEALYQCFATNNRGTSVSNAVFLKKAELKSFTDVEPREISETEGSPLTLDCNPPTGYPKPIIFWMIQSLSGSLRTINSSRITVDPEGNLHFSNVTLDDDLDDAVYACSATSESRNEYKFGSKIILKVEASGASGQKSHKPTKQYMSPPNIVALRGQPLELTCIFGGTPLPEVRWSKKGTEMYSSRFNYLNYGKTLQIRNVDFNDNGTYECVGSNGVGVPQTHAMDVAVHAIPFWITAPNNTIQAEGEHVRFVCEARGFPEPNLQWLVNGVPLEKAQQNYRRKVSGNVLTIDDLEKGDTAVYQCNASNVIGYAFRDFYLNVLALPPTITEKPAPLTKAVVTSVITLTCRVFGAPRPDVRWSKEGQELSGGRYQVLDNGDLEIQEALVTDQGTYTCSASNKLGDVEASGKLEVKGKTKITQPPENFEVAAGKSATFRCNAEADTSLVLTIRWLFNGQLIDFDQDPRMVQASDNSLTITKTLELDSGIYTCVASTELDQDTSQAILTVQDVPNPPRIVNVDCDGLRAVVEWKSTGDRRAPILSYSVQYNTTFTPDTWEDAHNNIPAPENRFQIQLSPWANYTFRVRARNKIGPSEPSGASEHCTTPEDVPFQNPDKVMGRGTQPDNLVISWTPMPPIEQNAPEFFYKVFWKRDDDPLSMWKHEKITDWRQNRLIIDYQPTFKRYRIKVEAHNRKGQAPPEAVPVIGYSGEDVPRHAPANFRLIKVRDAKSAIFIWDPVPSDSLFGHFRGYKLQTWTADETEEHLREVIVPPNVTEAVINILRPYSRNIVRVCAFNDVYNGPPSDAIDVPTPEGTPGPVSYFEAVPLGSSALYLIWKRPLEPNGELTGYNIYYREVDGTALQTTLERRPNITNPRETRAKLAGLRPDTKYRIMIHAVTKVGQGDEYFIEVRTNPQAENAPDVPNFVWSHLPNENDKAAILITWMPAVDGHPGSYFYVQFQRKGEGQWENTAMEENEDSIIVRGLDLGTLYQMRVVAVDGHHETPSYIEEVQTEGGLVLAAPEAPENIATAAWFIGMLCAIALLLLLLILVCLVKRNRGGKYSVHEKEAAQGRDLDFPDDGGFNEYTKPVETQAAPRGSRTSLTSSYKGQESDTDSMADYGEGEMGKFGEDGSFIGQYVDKRKKDGEATSPSALATFV